MNNVSTVSNWCGENMASIGLHAAGFMETKFVLK